MSHLLLSRYFAGRTPKKVQEDQVKKYHFTNYLITY